MMVLNTFSFLFLVFAGQCVVGDPTSMQKKLIQGKLGGKANLTCDVITDYRNIVLLFNKTKIKEKQGKFQKMPNGAFLLKNIQPSDTGVYKYKQKSDDLTYMNSCVITLQIIEETIIQKPGSTVLMSCNVPEPPENWYEVSWKRKYSSKAVTIVKNGSVTEFAKPQNFFRRISAFGKKLKISNAHKDDSGRYTCIVQLKENRPREMYYINLVVSMPSTIKPTTNEVISTGNSITSTPSYPASTTAKKTKSCATRSASYLPLAIIVIVSLAFCFMCMCS